MRLHATLAALLAATVGPSGLGAQSAFEVHFRTLPEAAFANAFVIETARHVVVIDPGFSPEHAARIGALADSTGKTLEAVLLTHAHVDHYGALAALDRGSAPVVTSQGVARQIDEWHAINYARFGMTPPTGVRPDRTLGDGQSLVVDGVRFTMHDAGPGESYADAWWLITAGDDRAAVIGDLAMYGLPPFVQSGHSGDWIRSLERVKQMIPEGTPIYIGHAVAAPGSADPRRDASILDWQIARLRAFRSAVETITGRERLLKPQEVPTVVARLHADAPENLSDFDFLITTSANVLAAELILERQKEQFEKELRALFATMRNRERRSSRTTGDTGTTNERD